jgi:hypothetical protein
MKAGIGYREFAEIAKSAFVDVATSDYGLRGRPTNISRVAVMTGLTRKEVRRLRDKIASGSQVALIRVIPPAEIIEKWHTDPAYLDSEGRPLRLPFDGTSPSFAQLVRKYGGDIPPGAMRTELKRVGAVVEDGQGNLTIMKRDFRPVAEHAQLETALGQTMYALGSTVDHNFGKSQDRRWVDKIGFSHRIREADRSRVRRISNERASQFVDSITDLFSAYETIYGDEAAEPDSESALVGVGVYYFEIDESESASQFPQSSNEVDELHRRAS